VAGSSRVAGFRYESLFSGDQDMLRALFGFCRLGVPANVRLRFERQTEHWAERTDAPLFLDEEQRCYVADHVDLAPMDRFDRRWTRIRSDATA
jgi:hypothetical protein